MATPAGLKAYNIFNDIPSRTCSFRGLERASDFFRHPAPDVVAPPGLEFSEIPEQIAGLESQTSREIRPKTLSEPLTVPNPMETE